jgi:hypothetical protein
MLMHNPTQCVKRVCGLMHMVSVAYGGSRSASTIDGCVPAELADEVEARRAEVVESVSEVGAH